MHCLESRKLYSDFTQILLKLYSFWHTVNCRSLTLAKPVVTFLHIGITTENDLTQSPAVTQNHAETVISFQLYWTKSAAYQYHHYSYIYLSTFIYINILHLFHCIYMGHKTDHKIDIHKTVSC